MIVHVDQQNHTYKRLECLCGFDGLQPGIMCLFGCLVSAGMVLEKCPGGPLKITIQIGMEHMYKIA